MTQPQPPIGDCAKAVTTTFTATGIANGPSRLAALDRAREQAQTVLNSWILNLTQCPAGCPVKDLDVEPDYDAAPPVYSASPDASDVLVCTAQVARVVHLSCSSDSSSSSGSGGAGAAREEA